MINHLVSQRYEVLEKIGEGPLFTVYKARDKVQNRVVALKSVAGAFARDEAFLQGLQRGLSSAANLNHPNIAGDVTVGEDEGALYATMEFVRGINLKERIRRIAPFTLSVAVDVACALAESLQYAHGMGQAHGDLRPHNIIMSPEGAIKVTDFGVMAGVAQSPRAQADVLARSAPYHAPELSITQAGTPAGDIYAVGAILYEMLTGTPLYAGDTLDAIADMHAFSPIPLPRVINAGVPRSLEGIIVKCLQKRPAARYGSAGELLNDLKSVRDALRFGKPLSWSPVDVDKLANDVPSREEKAKSEKRKEEESQPKIQNPKAKIPVSLPEPVAVAAASSQALPMPAKNRLRETDERVSIFIKIAIAVVTCIIFGCLIVIAGIAGSKWIEPETVVIPKLIGKNIEEVRLLAKQKKLHLIEHPEYIEKPRGIVFRTDESDGEKLHEGHDLNVWFSNGPTYVTVPKVVGSSREQAELALKSAGLTVGKVTPDYSDKVPLNNVMAQDVSYKKRVLHDTAVDLVISDGPKPDYGTDPGNESASNATSGNADSANEGNAGGNNAGSPNASQDSPDTAPVNPNPPDDPANSEAHDCRKVIHIPKDGKGSRKVRIEYVDANGLSITPVADETHEEDDRIHVSFTYYGKKITLRVFYDDKLAWTKTFDPAATKHDIVR